MSSQNFNFTPTEMRTKNVEPKNPTALFVRGPEEQQNPLQNLVKRIKLRTEKPHNIFGNRAS